MEEFHAYIRGVQDGKALAIEGIESIMIPLMDESSSLPIAFELLAKDWESLKKYYTSHNEGESSQNLN